MEHDKGPPVVKTSVTICQLKKLLSMATSRNYISDDDIILWAGNVEEGSDFQREFGCAPGSIIFGVQHVDNTFGVLRIEPSAINKYLC